MIETTYKFFCDRCKKEVKTKEDLYRICLFWSGDRIDLDACKECENSIVSHVERK